MLRFTLLLFVVVAVALKKVHAETDQEKDIPEDMVPIIEECSKDHGANYEEVISSKKNKDYEAVDGCLIECVFKKMGVIDDDGALVVEKIIENTKKFMKTDADSNKIEEMVKNCSSEGEKISEDKCVKSKTLLTCLVEQKEAMHS